MQLASRGLNMMRLQFNSSFASASLLACVLTGAAFAGGCGSDDTTSTVDDLFTDAERAKIAELSPLPSVPADSSNQYADDADAATLGQKFYYAKIASAIKVEDDASGGLGAVGDKDKYSCASCHEGDFFDDIRSKPGNVSLGIDWGTRNTPTVVNSAFYEWWYWEGRADTLWGQAVGAIQNPTQQAVSRLLLAHVVYDRYQADYEALFGALDPALDSAAADAARFPASGGPKKLPADPDGDWEKMDPADQKITNRVLVNFGKAIAAYERLLVSRNAPFDDFVAGDAAAISESAKRGLKLFIGKAGCVECHATPLFSDNKFHNVGVAQTGDHVPATDNGRYDGIPKITGNKFNIDSDYSDDKTTGKLDGLTQSDDQKGQFRTKHLRQIAKTGPYTHTGGYATLEAVVDLYNKGGEDSGFAGTKDTRIKALNLDAGEVADLVAFLETLTGEAIPAALAEDTSGQ